MRERRVLLFALSAAASAAITVACGGPKDANNTGSGGAPTCAITLPPRAQTPPVPLAAPAGAELSAARSNLIVHAEIPLALVQKNLEAKVQRRVADVRDQDIGVAGRLEYTADRGPFTVAVQGDALAVATPVVVHARACAKGSCYAGCDPVAQVTARVPLRLGADYKFQRPTVSITVTQGCKISALGGFASIDVTPMLESRLRQEQPRLEAQIRNELPDLRPEAERIWNDLSQPRPLALGACMVLLPQSVRQGVPAGTGDAARLSFGVLSYPELRTRCAGDPPPHAVPLPPLADDNSLPQEGDVHLSIVLPPETVASSFEGAQDPIDLGKGHAHLQHANGATGGTAPGLAFDLLGDVCGPASARANGAHWTDDGRAVHLVGVTLGPGDDATFATAGLDAGAFTRSIERLPIPVPMAAADLEKTIPDLARAESDARVDVSATISSARPDIAGLRHAGEVVAVVQLTGSATLRAK